MDILERRLAQNAQHQESAFRSNRLVPTAPPTLFTHRESIAQTFARLLAQGRASDLPEDRAESDKQEH